MKNISQERRKSWFRRHWILTILLCLFAVFVLLVITGVNPEDTKSKSSGLKMLNSTENQNPAESDQTTECAGKFFEQTCINLKLNECTKLCAGEDINIPAIKNECYSACYQTYYYGGEKDLDDLIKEYKGEK